MPMPKPSIANKTRPVWSIDGSKRKKKSSRINQKQTSGNHKSIIYKLMAEIFTLFWRADWLLLGMFDRQAIDRLTCQVESRSQANRISILTSYWNMTINDYRYKAIELSNARPNDCYSRTVQWITWKIGKFKLGYFKIAAPKLFFPWNWSTALDGDAV